MKDSPTPSPGPWELSIDLDPRLSEPYRVCNGRFVIARINHMTPYNNPRPGIWLDCSCQSADDLNKRIIAFASDYGFTETVELSDDDLADLSEQLNEVADNAVDFLNGLEHRTGLYWTIDDNSLFLSADVDGARELVDFVSSRSQDYPPDDFTGEWLHVSDHGNATLYVRENGQDKEIWGIV